MENVFRIGWLIFAAALIAGFAAYLGAPEHSGAPPFFIVPGAMFFDLAIAYASVKANPGMRVTQFRNIVLTGTISVLAVAHIFILALAFGHRFDLLKILLALLGFIIIGAGNYLPKSARGDSVNLPQPWSLLFSVPWNLPLSYLFGVRTWWTLSSDLVWNRTHRFTGRLWMLGGLFYVIAPWFLTEPWPMLYALVADWSAMVLLPILYSFWISGADPQSAVA